jgi:hypothetical protein
MAVARALGRAVDRSSRHDSTRPRHQDPHVRRRVAIGLIAVVNAADAILAVPARARGVERAIANGRALNDLARERTDLRTVLLGARPPRAGQPGQTRRPAHARRPTGLRVLTDGRRSAVPRPMTGCRSSSIMWRSPSRQPPRSAPATRCRSRQAKALMSAQALISLVTIA